RPDVGARLSLSPVLAASWRPVHHQTAVAGRRPEPREELGRQRTPSAPPPPLTALPGPWPLPPTPVENAVRGAPNRQLSAGDRSSRPAPVQNAQLPRPGSRLPRRGRPLPGRREAAATRREAASTSPGSSGRDTGGRRLDEGGGQHPHDARGCGNAEGPASQDAGPSISSGRYGPACRGSAGDQWACWPMENSSTQLSTP